MLLFSNCQLYNVGFVSFLKERGRQVEYRSLQHLRILFFVTEDPQTLGRQKYISLEFSFDELKIIIHRHPRCISDIASYTKVTAKRFYSATSIITKSLSTAYDSHQSLYENDTVRHFYFVWRKFGVEGRLWLRNSSLYAHFRHLYQKIIYAMAK